MAVRGIQKEGLHDLWTDAQNRDTVICGTRLLEGGIPRQNVLQVRTLFAQKNVDDFVMVSTSTFNTDQQFSIRSMQQVQHQSITNYKFQ